MDEGVNSIKTKNLIVKFFAVLTLLVLCSCNRGITVQYKAEYRNFENITDMATSADAVFAGKIINKKVEVINIESKEVGDEYRNPLKEGVKANPDDGNFVYTVYEVKISEVFKGTLEKDNTIEVKILGGEIGKDKYIDTDVAFSVQEEVIFFVKMFENKNMPCSLINPIQGYYKVVGDGIIKNANNPIEFDKNKVLNSR